MFALHRNHVLDMFAAKLQNLGLKRLTTQQQGDDEGVHGDSKPFYVRSHVYFHAVSDIFGRPQ